MMRRESVILLIIYTDKWMWREYELRNNDQGAVHSQWMMMMIRGHEGRSDACVRRDCQQNLTMVMYEKFNSISIRVRLLVNYFLELLSELRVVLIVLISVEIINANIDSVKCWDDRKWLRWMSRWVVEEEGKQGDSNVSSFCEPANLTSGDVIWKGNVRRILWPPPLIRRYVNNAVNSLKQWNQWGNQ